MFDPRPVTLEGFGVRLEPMTPAHAPDLLEASRDRSIWTWYPLPPRPTLESVESMIRTALDARDEGSQLPFVTRVGGEVVGSTRYLDIRRPHRGLEIGWTWIRPEHQRTFVNTACKRLLLAHAFEDLGAIRVQLRTDNRNERSKAAILRLGATFEGTLRHHVITHDGTYRTTAGFSILDSEWPDVRDRLDGFLNR